MERLKRLSLNKRYLNQSDKKTFLDIVKKTDSFFEIKKIYEDEVLFYSPQIIHNENVLVLDRYKYYGKYVFGKHWLGIVTFIFVLIILLFSGQYIREVEFLNQEDYNENIYQDVWNHLVKKGPGYVLDISVNELSRQLRNKYPEYAFVGLKLDSSRLIIDVDYQDVPPKEIEDQSLKGDLLAKCDGIIEDIIVKQGVVLVQKNQSVKKGEILVSGNLNILNDPENLKNLVKSTGYIVGKTISFEKIKVPKSIESIGPTGREKRVKVISLFGKKIGGNSITFDNYYTNVSQIFSFFGLLTVTEVTYYEQALISSEYDEMTAKKYAISVVCNEFEKSKVLDIEQITSLEVSMVYEEDDYYVVGIIVAKKQNIAVFRQY